MIRAVEIIYVERCIDVRLVHVSSGVASKQWLRVKKNSVQLKEKVHTCIYIFLKINSDEHGTKKTYVRI